VTISGSSSASSKKRTRVLFLAWGFSVHAKRRIQIFVDDPSFEVREEAVTALGRLDNPEAVEALILKLRDHTNDLDPLVQSTHTSMRWRKCDPYNNTDWTRPASFTGTPPAAPTGLDAWGDIVFDVPLPKSYVGAKRGTSRIGTGVSGSSDYFTLDGKSFLSADALPRNSVALRRVTFRDGTVKTSRLPLGVMR
jgi:hypothetical protein